MCQIDATENTVSARRFNVRGYPTVLMLSHGKMYKYDGKRTKKAITEWADGGFKDTDSEDVPANPNMWEALVGDVFAEFDVLKKDMSTLFRFKKNALIVTFAIGGVVGVVLAFGMFACLGGLNPVVQYVEVPAGQASGAGGAAGAGAGAPAAQASDASTSKGTAKKGKKKSAAQKKQE